MNAYDIIRKPVITEQSMEGVADKKYVFVVDINANKTEIKAAVEEIFGVKVAKVNTVRMQGKVVVIDSIKMEAPKTKAFAAFLAAVNADKKSLVVTAEADQNVVKSGRNIPGCEVTFANLLNVYDIVNANKLVVDKAALQKIEEVFA